MSEHKVRVSSKGQVVIPQELRKEYKISIGTELTLKPLDKNRLIIERVPKLSEFFGVLGSSFKKASELLERERGFERKIELERDEELRLAIHKKKKRR
jgi:bifunctional DNA-binding transcriptional regulator/antitoxin component of YhaV-PrlF toxin-antitoxin module